MIPKIIHYCWFSGDKKPALIRKCIRSWKKHLPDYEIRCWDGDCFDFDSLDFTREAMSVKQYAAASDYVRLYALYNYGGIYLDSDVKVLKSLDPLLDNVFFTGIDQNFDGDKKYLEAAIMGSEKGFGFLLDCMKYFETHHFIHNDGTYDNSTTIAPDIYAVQAKKYGFIEEDKEQILSNGIHIYPLSVFNNEHYSSKAYYYCKEVDLKNLYALHRNMGSWTHESEKAGAFWKFCYNNDMVDIYRFIENIRLKLKL